MRGPTRGTGLLAAAAVLVTLAATGGSTRPAEAAFPGANGMIAFTSQRGGNNEIYLSPDGQKAGVSGVATRGEAAPTATVEVSSGGTLLYRAATGIQNFVLVSESGDGLILVREDGGELAPGAHCGNEGVDEVICEKVTRLDIATGDARDRVDLGFGRFGGVRTKPAVVSLGDGDDDFGGNPSGVVVGNEVHGGDGADLIGGGDGDDTLDGGPGNDLLSDGAVVSDDTIDGGPGDDRLFGGGGVDSLDGGAGEDAFFGGAGDDTLTSSDNFKDAVVCGDGSDTAIVDDLDDVDPDCELVNPPTPIVVTGGPEASTLELKVDTVPGGVKYTFDDPAPLQVSDSRCQPGPPIVCETPLEEPVEVALGDGDDTVTLSGSRAFAQLSLDGEGGDDTLIASPFARGGTQNDRITSGNCGVNECVLQGGDGDDILTGGPTRDRLQGGTGSDDLEGGLDKDTADYSNFAVDISVELGVASEEPLAGADTIDGDIENLVGGFGNDKLTGSVFANTLEGGAGEDELIGDEGDDRLDGGPANDTLEGGVSGDGNDHFIGGPGFDTLTYEVISDDVDATLGGFASVGGETESNTVDADIERLVGGGGRDLLTGSDGDDRLEGMGADDNLTGALGADVLDGGADRDVINYSGPQPVTVTLADGIANDGAAGEGDNPIDIEDVVGGDGNDLLIGDAGPNVLEGGEGADILSGRDGDAQCNGANELNGGPGDDRLVDADVGCDSLFGEDGTDTADYSAATTTVRVDMGNGLCDDGTNGQDCVGRTIEIVLGGSARDVLVGSDQDNTLIGNGGRNELRGLEGADLLVGGEEHDDLFGGPDRDDLRGGDGPDTIHGDAGNDVLSGGDDGDDLFGGSDDDQLDGDDDDDALLGDAGSDTLDGGPGPDTPIDGGPDVDTLVYDFRTQNVLVDPESGGLFAPADDGELGEGDQVLDTVENVTGGSGDDTLTGTAAANTLIGNGGNDTLDGLGGPDTLEGGFGLDLLKSRDGVRDEDFCGPDADTVEAELLDNVSLDCENVNLPIAPPPPAPPPAPFPGVPTFPGSNVAVQPFDTTTGTTPVTVTFASVTTPGFTSLTTNLLLPQPPANFSLGTPPIEYEISTTAGFTPPVEVCINTTGITFPPGQPLALFHRESGVLVDRTTSVNPPTVCGTVSSLSPFAVMARKRVAKSVRCLVPNVKGKTLPAARKTLKRAHCALGRVRRAYSAKAAKGRILAQSPGARTHLRSGGKVGVVVSRGRRR